MSRWERAARYIAREYGLSWTEAAPRRVDDRMVLGRAFRDTKNFEAPKPTTPMKLLIWLHEAGHIVTGRFVESPEDFVPVEEAAWEWAVKTFRASVGEPSRSLMEFVEATLDEVVSRFVEFALTGIEETT